MDLVSQRRELSTHTRTHALCPSLALRGGGANALGKFPKKKVGVQNFFCFAYHDVKKRRRLHF